MINLYLHYRENHYFHFNINKKTFKAKKKHPQDLTSKDASYYKKS